MTHVDGAFTRSERQRKRVFESAWDGELIWNSPMVSPWFILRLRVLQPADVSPRGSTDDVINHFGFVDRPACCISGFLYPLPFPLCPARTPAAQPY